MVRDVRPPPEPTETDMVLVVGGDESFEVAAGEVVTTPLLPGLAVDAAALFDR